MHVGSQQQLSNGFILESQVSWYLTMHNLTLPVCSWTLIALRCVFSSFSLLVLQINLHVNSYE